MPQESAPADPGRDEDPARRAVGMPTGPDQPLPPGNPVEADWEPVITRPGRLTPGGLRAAIARAVMDVAPEKARKRREEAARDARVEQWAEDSGNAALMGRELPPAEVLAADQRITAWARQLKAAGLDGDLDVLRARAYLDLLLGIDSRPSQDASGEPGVPRTRKARPGRWVWASRPGQSGRRIPGWRGAGRIRRADQPDHPASHLARPG